MILGFFDEERRSLYHIDGGTLISYIKPVHKDGLRRYSLCSECVSKYITSSNESPEPISCIKNNQTKPVKCSMCGVSNVGIAILSHCADSCNSYCTSLFKQINNEESIIVYMRNPVEFYPYVFNKST